MPLRSAAYGGGGGTYPSLTPAPPYSFNPSYGGKFNVPDPAALAKAAADANAANMPNYMNVANQVDAANYIKMMDQIRKGNPMYDQQVGAYTGMTTDQLHGMVPSDVENQVIQFGAERGAGTGTAGSPANNAAMMKAFYDTSKAQQDTGAKNYLNFQASIPRSPIMDVTKMFVNPNDIYNSQLLSNTIAAAPDPASKAAADLAAVQAGIKAGAGSYGGGISPIAPAAQNNDLLNKIISGYTTPTATPTPTYGGSAAPVDPYASWYQQTYGNQQFGAPPGGSSPVGNGPPPYESSNQFPVNDPSLRSDLMPFGDYGWNPFEDAGAY